MYNGSRKVKGEANYRKKCYEHQGSEQGRGVFQKGNIKEKLRGYFGERKWSKWGEKKWVDCNITH